MSAVIGFGEQGTERFVRGTVDLKTQGGGGNFEKILFSAYQCEKAIHTNIRNTMEMVPHGSASIVVL